jgi:hypothetical protein
MLRLVWASLDLLLHNGILLRPHGSIQLKVVSRLFSRAYILCTRPIKRIREMCAQVPGQCPDTYYSVNCFAVRSLSYPSCCPILQILNKAWRVKTPRGRRSSVRPSILLNSFHPRGWTSPLGSGLSDGFFSDCCNRMRSLGFNVLYWQPKINWQYAQQMQYNWSTS